MPKERRVIPSPAQRTRKKWRCPVCGTDRTALVCNNPTQLDMVKCGICGFPFMLRIPPEGSQRKYVPKPKKGIRWQEVWQRAFWHFPSPVQAAIFMSGFDRWESANNAMNRLDGGGCKAREEHAKEGDS